MQAGQPIQAALRPRHRFARFRTVPRQVYPYGGFPILLTTRIRIAGRSAWAPNASAAVPARPAATSSSVNLLRMVLAWVGSNTLDVSGMHVHGATHDARLRMTVLPQ